MTLLLCVLIIILCWVN